MSVSVEKFDIIPCSREKHGYNTAHTKNNILLPTKKIERIRELYKEKTPLEQLALFYLINQKILKQDVRNELRNIILLDEHEFFDSEILINEKTPDSRNFIQYVENGKRLFIDGNGSKPGKKERDLHHLIPRSRRSDGFETKKSSNSFSDIGKQFHARWHTLYTNQHPLEILQKDFERYKNVLSKEIAQRIQKIVELDRNDFYIPKVLR